MLAKGPLSVIFDLTDSKFNAYTSGVWTPVAQCSNWSHAVIAVGVGSDSLGEYLIIRNSWGTGWGEKGYFRVRVRDSDKSCMFENYAIRPVVQRIKKPCVNLYSECGGNGVLTQICVNTSNILVAANKGFLFENGPTTAIFFKDARCANKALSNTFTSDSSCYGSNDANNNTVKGIVLSPPTAKPGCVLIYPAECLKGIPVEVCANNSSLPLTIGSFVFGSGVSSFTIYFSADYMGSSKIFSVAAFGTPTNYAAKSIKITIV